MSLGGLQVATSEFLIDGSRLLLLFLVRASLIGRFDTHQKDRRRWIASDRRTNDPRLYCWLPTRNPIFPNHRSLTAAHKRNDETVLPVGQVMKRVVSSSIQAGRNIFIRNTQSQHRFHSVLQASLPCQESVCIDNTMEEKSTKDLLHYSSIGIDEVFLNDISKMELVGDLKKRAQDFVVNEIDPSGLVASLALPECERSAPSSSLQSEQAAEDEVPDNPLEHCRQLILEKADEGSKRFPEIEALSARARCLLRNSTAETTAPTSSSDVPSTADSLCLTFDKPDKEERGVLFRALAYAFPLLNASRGETSAQIVIRVNARFHKLIPVLEHPETDLLRLYEYVAYGYVNTQRCMERNVIRNETPKLRLRDSIEREDRRAIHRLIAEETCGLLGTETIKEANDKVSLSIQWTKSAKRKLSRKRGGGNQQLLCVVEKTSIENLRMINLLSKYIHVRRGDIGIAGIKDMKAVTTQFLTIGHVAGVGRAQKSLERNGIKIKPVRFVAQPLKRGMLRGNRFEIMLRNVRVVQEGDCFLPANENHVNEAIRRLNKGFVNFFGMQRVGNPGTREMIGYTSRDIGRAILQQNHEEAIDFLLQGRKNVDRVDKFRETWKSTKDATLTIRDLPSNTDMWPRERAVLQGLKRYGDPCAAFKCLQYWDRVYYQNAVRAKYSGMNNLYTSNDQVSHLFCFHSISHMCGM